MAGKYTALGKHLAGLPGSAREITLTFEQIEGIIADQLPPSAHQHRAWWGNEHDGQHSHAHAWLEAGWEVDTVDQNRKWVKFRRSR